MNPETPRIDGRRRYSSGYDPHRSRTQRLPDLVDSSRRKYLGILREAVRAGRQDLLTPEELELLNQEKK